MFRPFHWRCDTPTFTILVEPIACYNLLTDFTLACTFPDVDTARQQLSDHVRQAFVDLKAQCFVRHPHTGSLHLLCTRDTYCLHVTHLVIAQLGCPYEIPQIQRGILEPLCEEMEQTCPHLYDEFSAQVKDIMSP